jgi:hypothetical protein
MADITTYLHDVLEAQKKGKHPWWRWRERFGSYYEKTFGSKLIDYEEFWKETLKDKKF